MRNPATGGTGRGRHGRRLVAVISALSVLAFVVIAVLSAGSATAHPSYGQPCRCHTPTQTATVTLKASPGKVTSGAKVTLKGTVSGSPAWTSVKLQKRKGTAAWKTFKTAALTSAAYKATWKAPAAKATWSFRAVYLGDNHLKKATSAVRKVKVS